MFDEIHGYYIYSEVPEEQLCFMSLVTFMRDGGKNQFSTKTFKRHTRLSI
jgi:hypothetical protein